MLSGAITQPTDRIPAFKQLKTSNPLLFISNTIDPVTSALKDMITFFPGAGSFYQNAVGVSRSVSLVVEIGS
jgi:hypothetical protein